MNTLPPSPSLPSLQRIPYFVAIDGLTGYLCGKIGQSNLSLTVTVFAIRGLANASFYHIANYALNTKKPESQQAKELESQKIFLVTSTLVNMTFLVALRELNIIGHLSSCLLGIAALGYLINRVSYIQTQERNSILKEISTEVES